jgi:FkbM family methyltransferase
MHPRPVACLRESVKLHPDFPVTVNHVAVTNRVGTVQFLPHPEHTTRSRIASTDGAVDIEAVTLDHYLQKQGIQRVDFLKMDIEGWEPVAFQGATESLKNGSLPVIFVELSTVPLAEQGFTAEDLVRPLREAGYRLYFVRPGDLENRAVEILEFHGKGIKVAPVDELPTEGSTDLLAVRPDLRA